MPELSLFDPVVLRGVVEKLTAPESMILLNRTDKSSYPFPAAVWDVIKGSRAMARPNVPNAEAQIVPQLGRAQQTASFIYLRQKKVFSPTVIHWTRQPGEVARTNAEAAVTREVADLNQRFDNFAEWLLWNALRGEIVLDYPEVQARIDYLLPDTHKPSPGAAWDDATPAQIVEDVNAWKRLIVRDGRVPAREAFASESTLAYIFNSFASTGSASANFFGGALLSDRMKDAYFRDGVLPGFLGLEWTPIETVYEDDNGAVQQFVPDKSLILGNFTDNRPIELLEGPTADDDAPNNFTGKYTKTWKEPDPSARQYLIEWNLLPIVTRPEQYVYVADLTSTG